MNCRRCGFLLLELVVVIGVISLLAMIAIPRLDFFRRAVIKTELNKLYSVCMYLQRSAVVDNKKYELVFDENIHSYCHEKSRYFLPKQVRFGVLSGVLGPPSNPHNVMNRAITFKNKTIEFYPSGVIKSGTVSLIDSKGKFMYTLSNAVSQVSLLRKYMFEDRWVLIS